MFEFLLSIRVSFWLVRVSRMPRRCAAKSGFSSLWFCQFSMNWRLACAWNVDQFPVFFSYYYDIKWLRYQKKVILANCYFAGKIVVDSENFGNQRCVQKLPKSLLLQKCFFFLLKMILWARRNQFAKLNVSIAVFDSFLFSKSVQKCKIFFSDWFGNNLGFFSFPRLQCKIGSTRDPAQLLSLFNYKKFAFFAVFISIKVIFVFRAQENGGYFFQCARKKMRRFFLVFH